MSFSTAAEPFRDARTGLQWLIPETLVIARRNLAQLRQVPQRIIAAVVQPLLFVLFFGLVFGGAIRMPHGSFREYLVAGALIQTLCFGGLLRPATAIATDIKEGVIDRFRSLPIHRSAFLFGHILASLAASALGVVVMLCSALAIGWRIHTDPLLAVAGFALLALFACAMLWTGLLMGLVLGDAESVNGIGFIVIYPLLLLSNTLVPAGTLPAGLRTFAEYNPLSAMTTAVRGLFGNPQAIPPDAAWPLVHAVIATIVYCGAILTVSVPLATRLYKTRTSN